MDMNSQEVKDKVNDWFEHSNDKEAVGLRTKLPSMPYPAKYEFYMRYGLKQPLTDVEVQRSMPKEPIIEGEPTPLSEIKVGNKYKIKVIASGTVTDKDRRACKDCYHTVAEDEDECSNPSCPHTSGEIVQLHSRKYKVYDATGKDTGDTVISIQVAPWQYDEFPDLTGKIVTLQGRYEFRESKSKKNKTYENYDFSITRLISVEDPWSLNESKETPKSETPSNVVPSPESPKDVVPKSEPKSSLNNDTLFNNSVKFMKIGLSSMDGKEIEQIKLEKTLMEKYHINNEALNALTARLEKSGILERDDVKSTYILHLKPKGE